MKKKGFTLIELVAVIVVLGIILAIAVPAITGIIKGSSMKAFESDAKMVLKGVDYKKLQEEGFDPSELNKSNIYDLLGISPNNYENVTITVEEGIPIISIIGADKWDGFIACGTFQNMKVVEYASDCNVDSVPPVLTVLGDNPVNMYVGETYSDAGATAMDNMSGNVTNDIIVTGTVNPNAPGTYTITYRVQDIFENESVATRTINVIDNAYPMITFNPNGNATYAKSYSTTITATDLGIIDDSSLKYVWSMSSTEPLSGSFTNTYTSGENISTPASVTGIYYLWAQATDTSGNRTATRSNVFNLDNTKPVITLNGNASITINVGSTYNDAGSTAVDNIDGTITSSIVTTGTVNPNVVGTYTITYDVSDSSGNAATSVTRTINVVDVLAPVITLNGSNPTNINVGSTYSDAGATAMDDVDGNVTSKITTTGSVNPNVAGSYTITYIVKDNANNTATATRTVNVIDNVAPTVSFGTNGNSTYAKTRSTTVTVSDAHTGVNTSNLKYQWTTSTTAPSEASFTTSFTNGGILTTPASVTGGYYLWILAKDNVGNTTITRTNIFNLDNIIPVITMNGSSPVTVSAGSTYTDAGAAATDAHSGISGSVMATGSVNINVVGTYTITYNVSDNAGNAATPVVRTINVIDNVAPTVTFGMNGNATWGKTRSTTVTVSDAHTGVNTSTLKYIWNTSTAQPSEASFATSFTNGGILTTPASVTGGYYLWILAKDNAGNSTITRTNIFNLDNIIPVITMNGSSPVTIYAGSTYTDAGAAATDAHSGISGSVIATGSVNINVVGTYTITYNVSDNAGNAATPVTRTVNVNPAYTGVPNATYTPGQTVSYAGINWHVIRDKGDSVVLLADFGTIPTLMQHHNNTSTTYTWYSWFDSGIRSYLTTTWLNANSVLMNDKNLGYLLPTRIGQYSGGGSGQYNCDIGDQYYTSTCEQTYVTKSDEYVRLIFQEEYATLKSQFTGLPYQNWLYKSYYSNGYNCSNGVSTGCNGANGWAFGIWWTLSYYSSSTPPSVYAPYTLYAVCQAGNLSYNACWVSDNGYATTQAYWQFEVRPVIKVKKRP